MTMVSNLKEQLRRDEAVRLKPYRDTSEAIGFEGRPGKLTIGVGRNLDDVGVRPDEVELMLDNDIRHEQDMLQETLPWTQSLDEARLGVLLAMSFNMGLHKLLLFKKTLATIQAGNYDLAADEMLDSLWATQVGARAHRLALQMRSGIWQ